MAEIRHVAIQNFRSIKSLQWYPTTGLNCLIGPGDSGKSTLLDAIDLALGSRRSYPFNDADFYLMDTSADIKITITLGNLDESLKNIEAYGHFFRGFDSTTGQINDEPLQANEIVLTLQLTVKEDLEPEWLLYSDRAAQDQIERRLQWKHRELIAPTKLEASTYYHLAWGRNSILNKLSEENFDVSSTLARLSRQTRENFAMQQLPELAGVLGQVRSIANSLGVPIGDIKALLDVKGVSLSNGAISLHDADNTPLRQMGTGSSRLLISGLQKAASKSKIVIVDEAEYGLEPFRITRLLNELGSKDNEPTAQVFITTHSPYVLKELQATQLHVIRKCPRIDSAPPPPYSHFIRSLSGGDQQQATLRSCAEAFFCKAVIVGEGSTEVGIVRGLDLYSQDTQNSGFHDRGVYCIDGGGGDNYFKRAEVFASLGYATALLKDSDITTPAHLQRVLQCQSKGVVILEWGNGLSTEGAIYNWCPLHLITSSLQLAAELNGEEQVNDNILHCSKNSYNFQSCVAHPNDDMRKMLATTANKYKWFKNIAKAEQITRRLIGPHSLEFNALFQNVINGLHQWAAQNGDQR